jgi:hypothetical protein
MQLRDPGCFFFLGALGWCWIFVVALIKFSIRSHLIVKLIYYLDMFPKFPMCSQQHQLFVQYACCLLGTCIAESNLRLMWFYVWSEYFYIGVAFERACSTLKFDF